MAYNQGMVGCVSSAVTTANRNYTTIIRYRRYTGNVIYNIKQHSNTAVMLKNIN